MAGIFFVSRQVSVDAPTVRFAFIAERIRKKLIYCASEVMHQSYKAYDDEGMNWIDLIDLDQSGLSSFFSATCDAYVEWKQATSGEYEEWQDLINCLKEDIRLKNSG